MMFVSAIGADFAAAAPGASTAAVPARCMHFAATPFSHLGAPCALFSMTVLEAALK